MPATPLMKGKPWPYLMNAKLKPTTTSGVIINYSQTDSLKITCICPYIGGIQSQLHIKRHLNAVARYPVGEYKLEEVWLNLKVAVGVRRGCYFLSLSLELHLPCLSRDTGYCTIVHA